jgi:dolichol-phosphate mannosyltransferase
MPAPAGQLHSVLVPVYNSAQTLEALVTRVTAIMQRRGLSFELVLVDDGSRDGSFEQICRLAARHPVIRGFRLSRNFGHQPALVIALQQSRGEYVAIIDDDLQDPPELLPEFFALLRSDWDVVYGIRRKRPEGLHKRLLFAGFYRLLRALSAVEIPPNSGDFCAMRRSVVMAMLQCLEAGPFLRGIRAWVGFRQRGYEYDRESRYAGESGYSWRKYLQLASIGVLSFSYVPLRLSSIMGCVVAMGSLGYAAYVIVLRLFWSVPVPGFATLAALIGIIGGTQLISIGLIGEYLARLHSNTRRWPVAIISATTPQSPAPPMP